MPRPALQIVPSPTRWTDLVAPVRLELLEAMRLIAPCSVKDIAQALDRPADTLYRHIAKLVAAGAVVEAKVRRSGRRFERVYDLAADDFRPGFKDARGGAANKACNDTIQSIVKIASRTARDSARASELIGAGDGRNIVGKIEHAWLSPAEFAEVREMMMRVKDYMDARKGRREGRLYLAAVVALPVTRKRGARRAEPVAKKGGRK